MDENNDETKMVVCIQKLGGSSDRYYVCVGDSEDVFQNNNYLKPDGTIGGWVSNTDYMNSYEECIAAILINHEIKEEIPTPKGYMDYVATKEVQT